MGKWIYYYPNLSFHHPFIFTRDEKMTDFEKRKNPRVDSHNLISYVLLDENDNPVRQGMGRTLNLSESGILLETHAFIDPQFIVSFTVSLEDEIMDIKGKVAYYKKYDDKRFESGIQFIETAESEKMILKQFAEIFKD